MDISLKCNVSLSKKLRAIMGDNNGRLVLIAENIKNGVGECSLMISGENLDLNAAQQSIDKETSIQFTPISVKNEIPSGNVVSNIFSTTNAPQTGYRTSVDRLAATVPPEKNQVPHAIKIHEEIQTPQEFKQAEDPEFRKFVSNINELMAEVAVAKHKTSDINPDSIEDPRKRAIAIEMKEQAESIDVAAYVVNDSCGSIRLNDIDLSLGLNMPVDLSRVSAKRLAASNDLKEMVRAKLVKFIRPDEVQFYREKAADGIEKPGLETYSTWEDAENSIGISSGAQNIPRAERYDIPVDDDSPSEQEELAGLINLTSMSGSAKMTKHSNSSVNSTPRSSGDARGIRRKF